MERTTRAAVNATAAQFSTHEWRRRVTSVLIGVVGYLIGVVQDKHLDTWEAFVDGVVMVPGIVLGLSLVILSGGLTSGTEPQLAARQAVPRLGRGGRK